MTLQKHFSDCSISEASDGNQLVAIATVHQFDMIITDLPMPKLSGLDAVEQIMHYKSNVVIMVISMMDDEAMRQQLFAAGVKGFLKNLHSGKRSLKRCNRFGWWDIQIKRLSQKSLLQGALSNLPNFEGLLCNVMMTWETAPLKLLNCEGN